MSTFKDILERDSAAFFNEDEFSSKHNIDGKNVDIIIDHDLLKERQAKFAEGTYIGDLLFYIQKYDFGYEPAIGEHIKFDGEVKFINDFQEDMGFYTITIGANMS